MGPGFRETRRERQDWLVKYLKRPARLEDHGVRAGRAGGVPAIFNENCIEALGLADF